MTLLQYMVLFSVAVIAVCGWLAYSVHKHSKKGD